MKTYRVTEVFSPYVKFDHVSADQLEALAYRGTAVHQYLYYHALDLWTPRPQGEAEGYCISGERWIDQNVRRVISAEREYSDPVLGYSGHPDLLVEDGNGRILLVDYKTPVTESKTWPLQLAAYHHLVCKAHKLSKKKVAPAALMLSPTGGNARFKGYYENLDYYFNLFIGLLREARYFSEE